MNISDEKLLELLQQRLNQKRNTLSEAQMFRQLEVLSEKLKRSEQLKTHFLSNIRNEITNPVSAVLGLSKTLLAGQSLNRKQIQRYAFLIHNEIFNLDFQMNNIFAAAEIEAGDLTVKPSYLDIKRMIEEVVSTLAFKAQKKNVTINTSIQPEATLFCTDAYMIHLILINLVSNAIEFSEDNSVSTIDAKLNDDVLLLRVTDYGSGIPVNDQQKIFERFVQLDHGSTKHHSGQGLGLSVVKELVELINGELLLDSCPGQGSEFTVTLPSLQSLNSGASTSASWNEILFGNSTVL